MTRFYKGPSISTLLFPDWATRDKYALWELINVLTLEVKSLQPTNPLTNPNFNYQNCLSLKLILI